MASAFASHCAMDIDELEQQDKDTRRFLRLQKTASQESVGSRSTQSRKLPFYASLLRTADSDDSYDDELEIQEEEKQPQDYCESSSQEESELQEHYSDSRVTTAKPAVARAQALSQACRTAYAEMRRGITGTSSVGKRNTPEPIVGDGPSGIQRRSFSVDMTNNLNQSSMQSDLPSPPPSAVARKAHSRPDLPPRRPSQLEQQQQYHSHQEEDEDTASHLHQQQDSTFLSEPQSVGNNTTVNTATSRNKRRLTLKERSESISRSFKTLTSRPECAKWTAVDVANWLGALGLDAYTAVFLENGVDGPTLLKLTAEQLSEGLHFRHDERHFRSLAMGLEDLKERRVTRVSTWEWSIEKVIRWLHERGLDSLESTFRACAIHGGVLFRLTEADFVDMDIGIDSPLTLRALIASIARARIVGSHPIDESLVPDWGPVKIREWLDKLHLGHLEGAFRAHGVNGALLMELDAPVLKRHLGTTEIQSIVLSRAIVRLRRQHYWQTSIPGKGWKKMINGSKYVVRSVRKERERRRRKSEPMSRRTSNTGASATGSTTTPGTNLPKKSMSSASGSTTRGSPQRKQQQQAGSPPKRPPRPSVSAPPMATPRSESRMRRGSSQSTIKSAMPFSFSAPPPSGPPPSLMQSDLDYSLTSS